jgi:penicillin amidase
MRVSDRDLLKRLGAGESIASLCESIGLAREEFDAWWKRAIAARVPKTNGASAALANVLRDNVRIERDQWGIPHISASNDADLFAAFGYAMAQDRLFQLDYLRRKGAGRLAEVLGPRGLEFDLIARTVGLNRIAPAEWDCLPAKTKTLVESFTAGINALIEECGDCLPIEFDLLAYRPEPWSPVDCLLIENEFRWYLTGRFPIIVMPELAKRALGDGPLYRDFTLGEADDEAILPPGSYADTNRGRPSDDGRFIEGNAAEPLGEAVGCTVGDPDANTGSNNWVVSGRWTPTGKPLLASDPHIAFEAVSCWYEVHLCGGSFHVAGMAYAGIPAVMFGRNERVAWGITNNICSQRDLYQEQADPAHPGAFLYDGRWEPAREVVETIRVKKSEPVTRTVRFSRNGPIVDEILPPPGNATGPVALKWLGAHHGGWLTALLDMDRANSVGEFREALRPWHVPTFNLVIADMDGRIAFQSAGRVPIRKVAERGYRPGWDPEHQWAGLIPFEAMPHVVDPARGWMATANNRVAAVDFPYPLAGRWSSGYRARRIRQMIEARTAFSRDDFRDMQQDALSLRAVECVPELVRALHSSTDPGIRAAAALLDSWDRRSEPNSVGATLFNVFFTQWTNAVAAERFDEATAALLSKGAEPLAGRLLAGDRHGWFQHGDREAKIVAAFAETLRLLTSRFGPDPAAWTWGKLHRMPLKHVLSGVGDLSQLLDHGGAAVKGDMGTVCNTGCGPDWTAVSGAGYRLIADLNSSPPSLWAVDGQSQSGHPGSPHYADQFDDWIAGRYHRLLLSRETALGEAQETLILQSAK